MHSAHRFARRMLVIASVLLGSSFLVLPTQIGAEEIISPLDPPPVEELSVPSEEPLQEVPEQADVGTPNEPSENADGSQNKEAIPPTDDLAPEEIGDEANQEKIIETIEILETPLEAVLMEAATLEDPGPQYSNLGSDALEQIGSSYNHVLQTLGTNLSGSLTRIDIKTSKRNNVYGSRPWINLYECDGEPAGSIILNSSNCHVIYSATSSQSSETIPRVQSFYPASSINFDPGKYYFFSSQGNNQFNMLPMYHGSQEDAVEGACYQYRLTSLGGAISPCATVSDLYFSLYGITKEEPEPGCTENCFSNVLFLPGIEASRLYTNGEKVWEPGGNSDIEKLYLNNDGTSKNNIYTYDIINEAGGIQNIYQSFSNSMDELVAEGMINEWRAYAYDWRQSVDDIIDNGTPYEVGKISLVGTIEALVANSKSGKVTIVTHSNGGLLAKALLQNLQEDKIAGRGNLIDSIDVLILVASPQIGTASAVPVMLHGYNQRILWGFLMDEIHARELGRYMPAGFGLLPTKEYINRVNTSPVTFKDTVIPSGVTTALVQTYGPAISSFEEYKNFLFGAEGRSDPATNQKNITIKLSEALFLEAETLHEKIDNWAPPEKLRVIEVAGWGLDTIASFEYYPKCSSVTLSCNFTLDERPRFTIDGDGTVVEPSAHYMGEEQYWVDLLQYEQNFSKKEHKNILAIEQLNDLISAVVKNEDIITNEILRNSKPTSTHNRLRLSLHSPVTMDAYDDESNHTGKICKKSSEFCEIEENIKNSSYVEVGEGKYLNLPEEELEKIELQGVGIGTFTLESEKVLPDDTSTTSSFIDIPVTTQTQAEIILNETQELELKLDVTGDGVADFTIAPSVEFDPILYLQIVKTTINSLSLPPAKIKTFSNKIDNIIAKIQQGKIDKAKLKAEKFKIKMGKIITKPDPKKPRPKQISKTDAQLILDMFNKLLDNLK